MKQVTAVIRPEKLEDVKSALKNAGFFGLMVAEIEGHGKQGGIKQQWRGEQYELDLLPKVSMSMVVKDGDVDAVIKVILASARTGSDMGEGKIFVYDVERVVRIRTGEEGEAAI